jgi:hypothetical protein
MSDDLASRISELLKRRPWYKLPWLLAIPRLIEMRNRMRAQNLHDTEEPPLARQPPGTTDPSVRESRSPDGTNNDLTFPTMGAAGRRFGRNFPLSEVAPDTPNLLIPNPRVVSRELMTRHQFQPVTVLNLLAAAWIQFMVHDWFVHRRSTRDFVDIPTAPGDDFGEPAVHLPRSEPEPAPPGSTRPPAYANLNSHWWDASQIYGSDASMAASLRTKVGGRLRIEPSGQLPIDPATGVHLSGFTDNWWIGLALLHTLFTLEHNYVADLLAGLYPDWDDDRLYAKAKLINSAVMAKIHTVEWTPAILPHPVIQRGMRVNWSGLAGEGLQDVFDFLDDQELLGGIVGSKADHHSAPYALTEEFVSVYRMHPLLPDEVSFHSLATGRLLETRAIGEVTGRWTPAVLTRVTMPDLFYSFGTCHPGAITLHNYPRFLQNLRRDNDEHLDLAAVDIFRDRERGVPRYNRFRRLLGKDPVKSFDELTDNSVWRAELKKVYNNDLEQVDLMTGLFAEPLPEGFGFSETAFRVFILMASRRLKSDRFFTDDYRPEIYTEFGLDYIKSATMMHVLTRHFPQLAPALAGVANAFHPWKKIQGPA